MLQFSSGKRYIGQTSRELSLRLKEHYTMLSNNKHYNRLLQEEYYLHGVPTVSVIEDNIVDLDELSKKEIAYIQEFNTFNNGLNLTIGGAGSGCGIFSSNSKLCEDDYLAIVTFLAETDMTAKEIAKELEVPYSIVNNISSGYTHTHLKLIIPDLYNKMLAKVNSRTNRLYKEELYYKILCDIAYSELTYAKIADKYGINKSIIGHIASGSRHTYLANQYTTEYTDMLARDRKHNKTKGSKTHRVRSPTGEVFELRNISKFARDHGIGGESLNRLVNGKQKSHKGWSLA